MFRGLFFYSLEKQSAVACNFFAIDSEAGYRMGPRLSAFRRNSRTHGKASLTSSMG